MGIDLTALARPADKPFLLTIIVPFFRHDGIVHIEAQALNGLRRWQAEMGDMIVAAPLRNGPAPNGWVPLPTDDPRIGRISFEHLPGNTGSIASIRRIPEGRRILKRCIERAGAMCFSIGGLIIDWGALGAILAHRSGRRYAVWTDRVESEVTRLAALERTGVRAVRRKVEARLMAGLERHVISRAYLGLFHGADTFDAYASMVQKPFLVHDIHLGLIDHIPADALEAKGRDRPDRILKIVYAGRMEGMKGPMDWVEVLIGLRSRNVPFEAVWMGDGILADAVRRKVSEAGLDACVSLPGLVSDRAVVLDALRAADILLFCHKTPESPRILIEALASGTPIVGYRSRYAADLIAAHGGGDLVPIGDTEALAGAVADLVDRPEALSAMIRAAYRSGAGYTDVEVFRHRSDLIKEHLNVGIA